MTAEPETMNNIGAAKVDSKEFATLIEAAEATFLNAEQLYDEARVLTKAGHLARALFLHQISLEECGKVELIGGWLTSILMGLEADPKQFYRRLAQHQAKNTINAYMLDLSEDELAARSTGDWKAEHAAFTRANQEFHEASNAAKNAALYVDISKGKLVTPDASVSKDMLHDFHMRNERFLSLMQPKVEMMIRWRADQAGISAELRQWKQALERLRDEHPDNPYEVMKVLLEDQFKSARSTMEARRTETDTLVFSYGSNMDNAQLRKRCPDAKMVGIALLRDYRLCFPRQSKKRGCGVSSVSEAQGQEVWGVVHSLNATDLAALDKEEGYRPDRDASKNGYNRVVLSVEIDGRPTDVHTYVAVATVNPRPPNAEYLSLIRNGARQLNLPEPYQTILAAL